MALSAFDPETGQTYYGPEYVEMRMQIPRDVLQRLILPVGKSLNIPVVPVKAAREANGEIFRRAHFRILPEHKRQLPAELQEKINSETEEHIRAKEFLRDSLREIYPDVKEVLVEAFECYNPENNRYRYPDVVTVFESGEKWAHEIQLSSITYDVFAERTHDMEMSNEFTRIIWYLGPECSHQAQNLISAGFEVAVIQFTKRPVII